MASVKLSHDIIKAFKGEGDVVAWLKKVKLVAKLQKIEDLASFLPLYLEGEALAMYLEMSTEDQNDAKKIEEKLKEAFCDDVFMAFAKLGSYKWTGEKVDVYANEIRRLADLAGFADSGLNNVVKLSFVNGFPDSIGVQLQQLPRVKSMTMSELIEKARILSSRMSPAGVALVASSSRNAGQSKGGGGTDDSRIFRGKCYRCGGPHMARSCKDSRGIICYKCGVAGHISTQCFQGNGERGTPAPVDTFSQR